MNRENSGAAQERRYARAVGVSPPVSYHPHAFNRRTNVQPLLGNLTIVVLCRYTVNSMKIPFANLTKEVAVNHLQF